MKLLQFLTKNRPDSRVKSSTASLEKLHSVAQPNVIAHKTTIYGNISISSSLYMNGNITGDISSLDGEGYIVIGITSRITGSIIGNHIIIEGSIYGDITAKKVEIRNGGIVQGHIKTDTIRIEDGGIFDGAIVMNSSLEKFSYKIDTQNQEKDNLLSA